MEKKKVLLALGIFITVISVTGVSYAYFSAIFNDNRNAENNGKTNFNAENLSNNTIITNIPNGIGSFFNADIYPGHKEVLGLSVTGSGSKNSKSYYQFKYEVMENGLGQNVKVSLYSNSKPIEITDNYFHCEKKNEKIENSNDTKYYETCEEKDLGFLIEETILNGGKEELIIGKDAITILKDNVDVTRYYYVVVEFLNLDSPQNEDMNRKLTGKVTVELIPGYEQDSQMKYEVASLNDSWAQEETVRIHVTNEKYNIVSMSEDLEEWEELENKGKEVTIERTFMENKEHTIYFQDEPGNVQEVAIKTTKVDNKKPTANLSLTNTDGAITIDASKSFDNESGIVKYYYSFDGESFLETNETKYSIPDNGISYGIATEAIKSIQSINAYIKVEDASGNISDIKKATLSRSGDNASSLAYDETVDNNLRYVGSNPNNYVSFNNELWRIIGVMNNIDDGTGKKETRLKIARNQSIGSFAWQGSSTHNEWSQSDLMKLMNPGYESQAIGGSLYWNRSAGKCYKGDIQLPTGANSDCSFTSNGLTEQARNLVGDAVWHTGTVNSFKSMTTIQSYMLERGTGVTCTNCSDGVVRQTTWIGKVALMYPSDYGYSNTNKTCWSYNLYDTWNGACKNTSWLTVYWNYAISPMPKGTYGHTNLVTIVGAYNGVVEGQDQNAQDTYPQLYLKSNVRITSGTGSSTDPFLLELK